MAKSPSYDGNGLVNLIAEIELRLTGSSAMPGLTEPSVLDDGPTYVLVLFDGLGVALLDHPGAASLKASNSVGLDAPFPTTTSVALATVATGLAPSQHGQVAHLTWMPDLDRIVNTLKWIDLTGRPVEYDYPKLVGSPNLWERLRASGVEPITVQSGDFAGSPLTRALYRGARFESVWDVEELVDATAQLAGVNGRFVFTYLPHVDFAGHVFGLESEEFADAVKAAASVWDGLAAALPPDVVLAGTADHGLLEFKEEQKVEVRDSRYESLRFGGDARGLQLWGDRDLMQSLADEVGGELTDPRGLVGPNPGELAVSRLGDRVLLAPDHLVLLPKRFDKRLRCYHGGLTPEETKIPLLVG